MPTKDVKARPASTHAGDELAAAAGTAQSGREPGGADKGAKQSLADILLYVETQARADDEADAPAAKAIGPARVLEDEPVLATPDESAAEGVAGPGQPLPHRDAIQRSFGRHDVGGITAHTGPEATAASESLGAAGYAFGSHVAFTDGEPGLHLAAHEAAHTVQQRGEVQRRRNDHAVDSADEAHAEAVADRVVAGASAEDLLDSVSPAGAAPATERVQRFATDEHRALGDAATKSGTKPGVGADGIARGKDGDMYVRLAADVWLTYGQMSAMAGDFFRDIWEMRALAAKKGKGPGTREELEYVYGVYIVGNRTKANYTKATVEAREAAMVKLLGSNRSHFLNPDENDRKQSLPSKAGERLGSKMLGKGGNLFANVSTQTERGGPAASAANAYAGFRMAHVVALREAYEEGKAGHDIFSALASEAFAGHFLTDAFAGGHVRVARDDIAEHWNPRVPMFPSNTSGYLAEQLAKQSTAVGVDQAFHQIRGYTDDAIKKLPFGFGDMMSNVMHNHDNSRGVKTNVAGKAVTLKGDHHLSESRETQVAAMRAIQQGIAEVKYAWDAGRSNTVTTDVESALVDGDRFRSERLMPELMPESQQGELREVDWHGNDPLALVKRPELAGAIGELFAEVAPTLRGAVGGYPVVGSAMERVVAGITANPAGAMVNMINWTPGTGGGPGGHNTDDNAVDYVGLAKATRGGLASLTLVQRARLLGGLLDGVVYGEEVQAMDVLRSAPVADARWLIKEFTYKYLAGKIDGFGIVGTSPFGKFAASIGAGP